MGVLGLWQLLAPVGQPVTLESLENKILAVDISIWLNQAIKGYRDAKGGSVANAHLLSLFSRLCKLLYYKIRPIMVFDGGVPELKKQTIINRQQRRSVLKQNAHDAGLQVLMNYMAAQGLQQSAAVPSTSTGSKSAVKDDIFTLPPLEKDLESENNAETELHWKHEDLTKEELKYITEIDIESEDFQVLPADIKQEILSTIKESRKYRHWTYYDNLPKDSNEFSDYQMQCLLKRRKIQSKLEEVHRDIQQNHYIDIISMYENNEHIYGEPSKVMSDDCTHYVLLKKKTGPVLSNANVIESNETDNVKKLNALNYNGVNTSSSQKDEVLISPNDITSKPTEYNNENKKNFQNSNEKELTSVESSNNSDCDTSNGNNLEITSKSVGSKIRDLVEIDKESASKIENLIEINKKSASKIENLIEIDKKSASKIENLIEIDKESDEKQSTTASHILISEKNDNLHSVDIQKENFHKTIVSNDKTEIKKDINLDTENIPEHVCMELSDHDASSDDTLDSLESVPDIDFPIVVDSLETKNLSNKSPELEIIDDCINKKENDHDFFNDESPITETIIEESQSSEISSNVKKKDQSQNSEKLEEIRMNLQHELEEAAVLLQGEQAKQQRQANTVQEHMVEDCKDLLKFFGIPYVVSPKEAEAQCAFYDLQGLTHGTITDDSDVWLFGGKRVYKNFFSQQKYVEFYQDKEVVSHFNLNRIKLICFAMLTGSDYTEGIENVGPVTAMEILSEFMAEGFETLTKFKEWWEKSNKHATPPKSKVRAKLRKLILCNNFPNNLVFEAYMNPEVDNSTEPFSWGLPDLDALRDYTKEKFGWNKAKVDDMLLPIIKRLNERTTQTHLDSFFTMSLKKEKNLFPSKRITSALKKINPVEDDDNCDEEPSSSKRKLSMKCRSKTRKQQKKAAPKVTKSTIKNPPKVIQTVQLSEESSCDTPSD